MAELLITTLTVNEDGWIMLDTVLGRDAQMHSLELAGGKLLRAATTAGTSTKALDSLQMPYAVQALVACPSLFEGLAETLWETITGDRVLDHVRGRLFS